MAKREVFIPKNSSVWEQAEMLAKMDGFKPGTKAYKKAVNDYLTDRYLHSSIPHIRNPEIPDYLHKITSDLLSDFIRRNQKNMKQPTAYYENRVKSAITNLASVFMELEMGCKSKTSDSSYNYKKGANEQSLKETELNRYIRYMIMTSLYSIIRGVFDARKWQIEALFKYHGLHKSSLKELKSKQNRVLFIDSVKNQMNQIFDGKNIITKFVNVSLLRKQIKKAIEKRTKNEIA